MKKSKKIKKDNPVITELYDQLSNVWEHYDPSTTEAKNTKVIEICTEILKLNPNAKDIYEQKANSYRNLEQYELSIKVYQECLIENPKWTRIIRDIGEMQYEMKDYQKALESLNNALELDSDEIFARECRSKVFKALGKLEDSINDQEVILDYYRKEQEKWDDPNHYYNYK
jgi:tetratricopeptide (TPR) repeat protein